MGTTINGEKASVDAMIANLDVNPQAKAALDKGKIPPGELLNEIMPAFGTVHDGYFFTVWNEYYDDYNPSYEFTRFVALYYGLVDEWGDYLWEFESEPFSYGANAHDVAESLGIELDDEDDEE